MHPVYLTERGFVLPLSLIFLAILSLLGSTAVVVTTTDLKIGGNYKTSIQSFYDAEAGIQDGIGRLVNNEITDDGYETDVNWNAANSYVSTDFNNSFTISHYTINSTVVTSQGRPLYKITSTGTSGTSNKILEAVVALDYPTVFGDALCGCDGINFADNAKTGSYNSDGAAPSRDKGSLRTINSNANISLYGDDVQINGSVSAAGGVYVYDGHVKKDVLANDDITLDGSARVDGDANTDGNLTMDEATLNGDANAFGDINLNHSNGIISGNATASGSISCQGDCSQQISGSVSSETLPALDTPIVWEALCDPLNLTSLFDDAEDIATTNDNSELHDLGEHTNYPYDSTNHTFKLDSNDEYTFGDTGQSKAYYFTDFLLDSDSRLLIEGDVTVYVHGDFKVDDDSETELATDAYFIIYVTGMIDIEPLALMNFGGKPQDLQIYCNAVSLNNSDFKINLNSKFGFWGIIYAPNAAVRIDSSWIILGAVRGKYVEVASSGWIYYDEDLVNLKTGGIPTGYSVVSWREVF